MISHGDEMGRTQHGNNNAYCQDSPLTWVSWDLNAGQEELLAFTRRVFALRAATPFLQRRTFFHQEAHGDESKNLSWLDADGNEMSAGAWHDPANHVLGMLMQGERDALLLLLNGSGRSKPFTLPSLAPAGRWTELVNTFRPGPEVSRLRDVTLGPRSLLLLRFNAGS
jgi:glycogen operon protein